MARKVLRNPDQRRPRLGGVAFTIATAFIWAACGSNEPGTSGVATGAGAGGSSTSGGSTTTSSGVGGTTASSTSSTGSPTAAASGNIELPDASTDGGFEDCQADVSMAQGVGLDMYIVFDRSGSMRQGAGCNANVMGQTNVCEAVPPSTAEGDCPIDLMNAPGGTSKWCLATNALARFFTAPTQLDVRVAFQFMSPDDSDFEQCGAVPENPHGTAAIGYTQLPVDAASPLITALDADAPTTNGMAVGTRIEGALNGIAMYTTANADPARKTIGVLITDGDPFNCNQDAGTLGQIAQAHYDATGIATFVVGMTGATANNLEVIAANGGGPEHGPQYCDANDATCHYWTVGDGDPTAFSEVLAAIQDSVIIACEYAIPEPSGGQQVDPELVAVTYDDASGTEPAKVSRVSDEASCDPATGGWYFDDPSAPTSVRLCPTNCTTVSAAPSGAALQIRYGCKEGVK